MVWAISLLISLTACNTALLKKVLLWGLVFGLPLNLLRTGVEFSPVGGGLWPLAEFVLNAFALAPMAMAYCAAAAIVVTRRPHWLAWIAPVGRTALSNYLFQSLICIFIFYGVGLGYGGTLGYSGVLLVALVLFGC